MRFSSGGSFSKTTLKSETLPLAGIGPILLLIFATASFGAEPEAISNLTFLRDLTETRQFTLGLPAKAIPTADGKAVLFLRGQARDPKMELLDLDLETGRSKVLLRPEELLKGAAEKLSPEEKALRERMRVTAHGFADFQLSSDERRILLNLSGKLYVFDRFTRNINEIKSSPGSLIDAKFSPDGTKVSYVLNHDVYQFDLQTGIEHRVTAGGSELISHGLAEFVAREEMLRFSGYWWSPDSRSVAFEESDVSSVETWYVSDPANPGDAPYPVRYPRPGKPNAKVRLGVVSIEGGHATWIDWDREKYPYLATVTWSKEGPLTLGVQTRDQKEFVLLEADPETGRTVPLLAERDAAWVDIRQDAPRWLENDNGFIWVSQADPDWQLEWRDRHGKLRRILVPPEFKFRELLDVNPATGDLIFSAAPDPTQRQIYRGSLNGGPPVALSSEVGWHQCRANRSHSIYVEQFTGLRSMPRTAVHRLDGSEIAVVPSVAEGPPFIPNVEFTKAGKESGFYCALVRPRDFVPAKKYPVIVHVYGGPLPPTSSGMVTASMPHWLLLQWLADQGFVVASVDGRGSPGRGRAWERAIYQHLGPVPLEDQVAGLRALGSRFPELDLERAGIFGWSFGGYLSAYALMREPGLFKAAVAGAPVTDWMDYDTHYTERYLGIPPDSTAMAAYAESSIFSCVPQLRRPLLLIHGTTDDNVYFRHTVRLADALFRAGKPFELLPLSGFTHLVPDPVVSERLNSRIVEFFKAHLTSRPEEKHP